MSEAQVSVVIATRSRPQLVRRAIRSILEQEGVGQLEILVVFDGCEPDPLSDIDPGRNRIRVLTNARTPGLAGGRNTGILAARAAFVAFCDDDDEWKPEKLAAELEAMADPAVQLVATGIEIRSSGGSHTRVAPPSVDLDDLLLSRITELHPSSFLLRTDSLREGPVGLVDEQLPASYGEDYDLLLRAAACGRIVSIQRALTVVHWDRKSYFTEQWRGIVEGLSYLLEKHPEFERSRRGESRIEGQIAFASAALGERREARRWGRRALGHDFRQPRAYLAMLIGMHLLSGDRVVAALNRRGRGV